MLSNPKKFFYPVLFGVLYRADFIFLTFKLLVHDSLGNIPQYIIYFPHV